VAVVPRNGLSAQAFILDGANVYPVTGIAPGTVSMFAMSAPLPGWLECDGSAISRATYASLFATIGTTYGSGDGSTTFNIPDTRGYFGRAWDHGAGRDPGRAFGSTQTDAFKSHTHTGTTSTIGDHQHTIGASSSAGASSAYPVTSSNTSLGSTTTNPAGAHSHTFTTNATGGTETRPMNIAFLFAIKT
jgi:microcystin-dependent protein